MVKGMAISGHETVEIRLGFIIDICDILATFHDCKVTDDFVLTLLVLDVSLFVLTLSHCALFQSGDLLWIGWIHIKNLSELPLRLQE
jgi:hypothetical protein